jgi:hypothetical protein
MRYINCCNHKQTRLDFLPLVSHPLQQTAPVRAAALQFTPVTAQANVGGLVGGSVGGRGDAVGSNVVGCAVVGLADVGYKGNNVSVTLVYRVDKRSNATILPQE